MNTSHIHTPGRPLMAVGLIACLVAVPVAWAQNRVGSDGRALDANQQVGSAGYNPADGRLDFSHQNDIVTGNVSGGRGFQDSVGYGAVSAFEGTLPSDSLFNFNAQSLSSSPGYFNAASVGGVGPRGNIRVYRSFTNRAAQPQSPGLIAPRGGTFQLAPNGSLDTIRNGQFSTFATGQNVGSLAPGRALQSFSSSPALGLHGNQVTSEAISRALYEAASEANSQDAPASMIQLIPYGTNPYDPFAKPKEGDHTKEGKPSQSGLRPGQIPPTLMIGQQLQTLIDPNAKPSLAGGKTQILDTLFNRMKNQDTHADQADAYQNLLREIYENKDKDKPGANDDSDLRDALESPTSQQLTEAERAYDQIMQDMYGEDYKTRRDSNDTTPAPDAQDDGSGEDVRGVVDRLNYDLPRIQTLASNKQTRIARLTREAETALANGKYLSAESRYRQLILEVKDDPLLRIGLVHAQLGAGMFRSAGMNLRAVFVQYPELIAARYDAKLLPPESRIQWVQQELQDAISQGEGGKDAPLLMAYLGYQASSRQVVRYGLALAQAKSPRDPLLAVLREIWLDKPDGK